MGGLTATRPAVTVAGRLSFFVFFAVAAVVGVVKIVTILLAPDRFVVLAFNSDDVHYYVLTALNAATGHGSTFDGLTPTNGYQPLWFVLLTVVFRVAGVDRPGAYVATMVVLVVLWFAALALLYRLGRDVLGATGALAGLLVFLPHARWWTGCENALVVVVLLAAVGLVLRRPVLVAAPSTRAVGLLGATLAVLVLSRLDTLVFVAVLAAAGLVRWRVARMRLVVLLVGPAVAVLAVYAAVNQLLFGVPVPVSGLAKQLGPWGHNFGVVRDFLLYGQVGPLPLFFGLTVVVAGAAALWLLAPARALLLPEPLRDHAAVLRDVLVVLLLAQAGQLAYYAILSSWELQSWYFSFGLVALVLSVGVVGARLADRRVVRLAALGLVAVVTLVVAAHEVAVVRPGPVNASPYAREIDAGAWADAHLPPGAVLAMGDWAGTLAASTHHPVVQLEGLVSSPAYLDALRAGTARQFLAAHGVTHYARLTHPGEVVGCSVVEPYFGLGPKTTLDVCGKPLVYRGDVGGVIELLVWDVRG